MQCLGVFQQSQQLHAAPPRCFVLLRKSEAKQRGGVADFGVRPKNKEMQECFFMKKY
jgi:hypothetical protein